MGLGGGVTAHTHKSVVTGGELYTEYTTFSLTGLANVDYAVPSGTKKITVFGDQISGTNIATFISGRLNGLAAGYTGTLLSAAAGVVSQGAFGASFLAMQMDVLADIYAFEATLHRLIDSDVGETWVWRAQGGNNAGNRFGFGTGSITFGLGVTLETFSIRAGAVFDAGRVRVRMEH